MPGNNAGNYYNSPWHPIGYWFTPILQEAAVGNLSNGISKEFNTLAKLTVSSVRQQGQYEPDARQKQIDVNNPYKKDQWAGQDICCSNYHHKILPYAIAVLLASRV